MRQVACIRGVLLGLLFAAAVFAQRDLGTIAGTVTDPTGAGIPNAKITITEVATNLSYDVISSAAGEYTRPALKPGIYTVAAEAQGFRRVAQENVVVTAGDRIGVNLSLPVGNVSESIEVSANAPLLQTVQCVAHRILVQLHHRIAIGLLVAGVDQSVQRETPRTAVFPPTACAPPARTTSC